MFSCRSSASRHLITTAIVVLSLAFATSSAFGVTNYTSALGTWNNGGTGWSTVSGGPYTGPWTAYDDAIFQGTASAVTAGTVNFNNMTFTVNGYSVTGGAFTMGSPGGGPSITVDPGFTATFSPASVSHAGGFTHWNKAGTGTLILGGTDATTTTVNVNAGTLRLGSATALNSSGTLAMSGTSTFDLNNFNATVAGTSTASTNTITNSGGSVRTLGMGTVNGTLANVFSGSLALTVSNANQAFALSNGSNTFSGGITLLHTASGTRMSVGTIVAGAYGTGPITIGLVATDKAGIYFPTANQTLTNAIVFNTELGNDRPGIRFDGTGNTLSGQITANNSNALFSTNGTGAVTLTGKVTGTNGVTLDNAFGTTITVTLNNAAQDNDYAGTTTIEATKGVLVLGANNQIPNGAGKGNVQLDGTLNLNGKTDTINGLNGSGTLTSGVAGAASLTVGDNNTMSTFGGIIQNGSGTVSLIKTGSGTLTLTGANTYSGGTTINANSGTLSARVNSGQNSLGTGAVSVGANSTLYLDNTETANAATTTISNTFTGTGLINLNFAAGTNPRSVTMANVTGFAGTIELSSSGATGDKWNATGINAPSATVQVDSGAQIFVSGADTFAGVRIIGTGNNEGRGAIRLASTLNAPVTLLGNATIGPEGGVINGTISTGVAGTSTLTLGTANSNNFAANMLNGVISNGTGTLALEVFNQNSGSVFISGASLNTYSGGTTLLNSSSGTRLVIGSVTGTPYGSGPITIGQVNTDRAGIYFITANQTLTNAIVFNTELGNDRPGIRLDATNVTLSGQITANNSNALFSTNGTGSVNLTGRITGSQGLTLDNAFGTTITATLNNTADNNDYSGTTRIEATTGVLVLGRSNQIPNGVGKGNVQLDGTLNLNGFSDTINGLAGAGTLDGVSGTPTFTLGDANATGSNFSGVIKNTAGSLAIVKNGTGDQTFSGANTYGGGTQINAGRLVLTGTGTYGAGAVTVASGGEAFISTGATHNNTFNISGDGGNSIDPQLRGAIRIENSTIGASGSVVLQADASIGTYNSNTGTINAVISESGGARALSINKSAANAPGTIVLGGANTFTGDTRIYNGTLQLNNVLALQNSTLDMNAADAGALSFGTLTSATFGGLKGSRNLALQNNSAAAVALTVGNNNQSTTYSGQLTGGGSLAKIGTGTLTLTGGSTYSGVTSVQGGTLELGTGGSIANTSSVTVGVSGNGTSDRLLLTNAATHRLGMGDLVVGSTEAGTVDHNAGNVTVGDTDATLENVRIGVGAAGIYNINNGATSTLNIGADATTGRGNLIVGDGNTGTLNVGTGATINTGDLLVGNGVGTGTVNQTGGTINVINPSTYTLNASDAGGTALTAQSGGTTNVTGGMVLGNGTGAATQNQYNLSGGILDFGDTTGVTAGQHHTAGTTPSALTINSDASFNFTGGSLQDVTTINTAGGVGTFTQSGGFFFVGQDEPTHFAGVGNNPGAPDNTARTTTINGGFSLLGSGRLHIDAFGPEATPSDYSDVEPIDLLRVTGIANLNGVVDFDDEYGAEFGDVHTLVLAPNIILGPNFALDGGFFRVVPTGPTGPGFALQAIVPEPASVAVWTMIGLVGAAGAWRCGRRRR